MLICLPIPAFLLCDGKGTAMMKFSDIRCQHTAQRRNPTFMRFSCFALSRVFSLPSTDTPKNSSYVCIPASSTPFFCVFFSAIQSFSLYTFSCALNRRIRCPFGRKVFSLPYDLRWSEMCSSLSLKI